MKARFIESFEGYPRVEIMPDSGDFNGIDGRIEVSFFQIDVNSGKSLYEPRVTANVSFGGSMHPDMAYEWGDCFNAAGLVANRGLPNYSIDKESRDAIVTAFSRIIELRKKIKE